MSLIETSPMVGPDYSSPAHRTGLALIGVFGILSAVSTFILLAYFLYCYLNSLSRKIDLPRALDSASSDRHRAHLANYDGICDFINSTLGRYLVYLFICDHLQGIAFAINFRWAKMGGIATGSACTTQGAFDQIGNIGAAFWSLLIGFQTFSLLFLQIRPHRAIEVCATIVVWSAVIILPIVAPYAIQDSRGLFWSISGLWCWIGNNYEELRLYYLYIWIFLNLATCFCMYSLIYLKFAGVIEYHPYVPFRQAFRWNGWCSKRQSMLKPGSAPTFQPGSPHTPATVIPQMSLIGKDLVKIAQRLMWYPLVYAIVIIPVAICRMGALAGWTPPFWFYVFAGVCYTCSGLSNTLLFLFTRHTFIKRRARTRAIYAGTARRIEITIDVTHTTDHPLTPLPAEDKPNWDSAANSVKAASDLKHQTPELGLVREPAIADLEAGKSDGADSHEDDDGDRTSRSETPENYENWLANAAWDPSKRSAQSSPKSR